MSLLSSIVRKNDDHYSKSKVEFLGLIGQFEEALRLVETAKRKALERGFYMNLMVSQNWKVLCAVGLEYEFSDLAEETRILLESVPTKEERESPDCSLSQHL